jgi:hypothetical protein
MPLIRETLSSLAVVPINGILTKIVYVIAAENCRARDGVSEITMQFLIDVRT